MRPQLQSLQEGDTLPESGVRFPVVKGGIRNADLGFLFDEAPKADCGGRRFPAMVAGFPQNVPVRYTTRIIVPPRVKRSSLPGGYGGNPKPQALGFRKTFGFGDRLGLAAAAHLAVATAHREFAPVFAQQSSAELAASGRTAREVIHAAARGVERAHFRQPWGADADGLRTPREIEQAAEAGYSYFTIDGAGHLNPGSDQLAPDALAGALKGLIAEGALPEDWIDHYLDRTIELPGGHRLKLTREPLERAAAKYVRAIVHCARMSETAARANQGRPYELEVSFARAGAPMTALEHLFAGLELEARGVRIISMGLRIGEGFEPGIDYQGDLAEFETSLREHVAVADFCGPHKLSFAHAADKWSVYPILTRCCGDALHLKTSGMSYLEALRVILQVDAGLFAEIAEFSRSRFAADRESAISTTEAEVLALPRADEIEGAEAERIFLEERAGRQMLHAAYGSVIAHARTADDRAVGACLLERLEQFDDLYQAAISQRLERHFAALEPVSA